MTFDLFSKVLQVHPWVRMNIIAKFDNIIFETLCLQARDEQEPHDHGTLPVTSKT